MTYNSYAYNLYNYILDLNEIELGNYGKFRIYYSNPIINQNTYLIFLEKRKSFLQKIIGKHGIDKLFINIQENNSINLAELRNMQRVNKVIAIIFGENINIPEFTGNKVEVIAIDKSILFTDNICELGVKIYPYSRNSISNLFYNRYLFIDLRKRKIKCYIISKLARQPQMFINIEELKRVYPYEDDEFWNKFLLSIKEDNRFIITNNGITIR